MKRKEKAADLGPRWGADSPDAVHSIASLYLVLLFDLTGADNAIITPNLKLAI